ncbi:MAG: menaquinone biosynthesis protein [Bacteroidales bacterium]|nr:menaquinone biosynthesis protein [Bacteroidales bacterium]
MKKKIKISAVSYLNTLPFIYGIENDKSLMLQIDLQKDIPSVCADKLLNDEVDIGLIPVAEISKLQNPQIISNYCLGAVGKVDTVSLFCHVPIKNIKRILLDYQSRTSVRLTKILVGNYFNINPEYVSAEAGYEDDIDNQTAALIIGDRVFKYQNKFEYIYDLSEIWLKYTSYPFVFAVWAANKKLNDRFVKDFNNALKTGLMNIDAAISDYKKEFNNSEIDLKKYLTKSISYSLDVEKRKGMQLFLDKIKELKI